MAGIPFRGGSLWGGFCGGVTCSGRYMKIICGSILFIAGIWVAFAQTNQSGALPVTTQNANEAQVPPEVEKAMQMPESPERTKAVRIAAREWAKKDPVAVLSWAVKLPNPIKDQVGQAIPSICAQTNGKASADWSVQKGSNNWLLHPLLFYWAAIDPAGAIVWCGQAPEEVRYLAYFSVGDGYGMKDPPGAEGWAVKLESPDDRLSAIRGVALRRAREKDIPTLGTWLKSLKPEEMMVGAKSVVWDWQANNFNNGGVKNNEAIKEWLDQFPLNDSQREDILKTPLPGIFQSKKIEGK